MEIKRSVIWSNRSGENVTWFHPKCCKLKNGELLMLLQSISGSDFYGPVCESFSNDAWHWSDPAEITGLGLRELDEGITEGICDVVPNWHAASDTVLAIGHNVYNKNGAHFNFISDKDARSKQPLAVVPYWSVRNAEGAWVKVRQKLEIPGFEECTLYTCGCTQWFFRGKNEVLIPFFYGYKDSPRIKVCTVKFFYDGTRLEFIEKGEALEHPGEYAFVEPSMIEAGDCVIMTLRSDDKRAYVTKSSDALHWEQPKAWQFDDGEVLTIFSTQQHLLRCGGRNWLFYTRETEYNKGVKRFRTPMFIAEINDDLELIRESENIVFPMIDEEGKGAGMGNFHVLQLSDTEALVTVGEERSYDHFFGDTLEAYIKF